MSNNDDWGISSKQHYQSKNYLAAWYCPECKERYEQEANDKYCPNCAEKMIRCSRYEWFLYDALEEILFDKWEEDDSIRFNLVQQWPLKDHRGFNWYFDIYVHVYFEQNGPRGYTELIEVNGEDHNNQKTYSGPGGGYTRDYDKKWEAFSVNKLHKYGYEFTTLVNDECSKKNVKVTAQKIIDRMLQRAKSWN